MYFTSARDAAMTALRFAFTVCAFLLALAVLLALALGTVASTVIGLADHS